MDHTDIDEDTILLKFSVSQPDDINHPERRIRLTESLPPVRIGRSSTRAHIGFQPAVANGWFNSPVMSRSQAEITADFSKKALYIRDLDSMHGTYLNKARVNGEPTLLRPEDELIFGLPVYRHDTNFQPVHVTVDGIEFLEASRETTSPTRVFTVPDDCSTDDNEYVEDEQTCCFNKGSSLINIEEAPDTPRSPRSIVPQVDGVIDLVSEVGDVEPNASQVDNGSEEMSSGTEFHKRFYVELPDDDDESLRLTDGTSSETGSVKGAEDRSDTHRVGDDDDEVDDNESSSPSWDSLSLASDYFMREADEDEEDASVHDAEADYTSWIGSESEVEDEHQQGMVCQDYSSPTSSELGQNASIPCVAESTAPFSNSAAQDTQTSSTWLPSINSLIPVEHLGYSAINLEPGRLRLPSPSDAVLPHSNRRQEMNDEDQSFTKFSENAVRHADGTARNPELACETLGQKTGKSAFFEAREHNKMTIYRRADDSSQTINFEPTISMSGNYHSRVPQNPTAQPGFSENSFALTSAMLPSCQVSCSVPEIAPATREPTGPETLVPLSEANAEQQPVNSHTSSQDMVMSPSWEPSSAWELEQHKRLGNLRARTAAWQHQGEQVVGGQPRDSSNIPLNGILLRQDAIGSNKGKRKADMISDATERDLAWATTEASTRLATVTQNQNKAATSMPADHSIPLASTPPPAPAQSALPSPPSTPEAVAAPEARPSKRMRKIAERVGFAALGGATVGAMVLTSLIYSAPTFV